jgi:hypothetical protein
MSTDRPVARAAMPRTGVPTATAAEAAAIALTPCATMLLIYGAEIVDEAVSAAAGPRRADGPPGDRGAAIREE